MRKSHNFLTTPVYKIINNLNKVDIKPPVVLLTTGGFSPIHRGHLQMMEIAKREMEIRGYSVLGGYLSPSHDGYIPKMYQGIRFLKTPHRLALCEIAVHESDWLMVDSWEARYNKKPLLYPKVISHLREYLSIHLKDIINPEILYVFGSDNADFITTFLKNGSCICVRRPGFESRLEEIKRKININHFPNIIISEKKTRGISSSTVRLGLKTGLSDEINNKLEHWMKIHDNKILPKQDNQLYIMRNDISWATSQLKKRINKTVFHKAKDKFVKGLINSFDNSYLKCRSPDQPFQCKFQLINLKEQTDYVNKLDSKNRILNLDLLTDSKYKLHMSRLYGISSGQCHADILTERPRYKDFKRQIKKISDGKYVFLDDDIASGETRKILLKLLSKRIKITKSISLLKIYLNSNKLDKSNMLDIVDLRDFLAGSKDAGLVVSLPDGKICRAPYMLPYVSLTTRAKIPPSTEYELSVKLWGLNVKFYRNLKRPILLKDTDESFQKLMTYIGFSKSTSLIKICRWHENQLSKFI